jgi:hypothetical protein
MGIERVSSRTAETTGFVETKITSGAMATTSAAALRIRAALSPVNR